MTRSPFVPILVFFLSAGSAGAASDFLWEGFEREINWSAIPGTSASGRLLDADTFTEGSHSLKLVFRAVTASGKAVYARTQSLDWSRYGALVFDVYNPTDLENMKIGIEIGTSERFVSHEFITPPLEKGWNRNVRVELKKPVFSTAGSNYRPVGFLANRNDIRFVAFIVYPGEESEGSINVDNLRLERAGILTSGSFGMNATVDLTVSGGHIDYLPPDMRMRDEDFDVIESFEAGTPWTTDADGIVIEPAADFVSRGSSALSVSYPAMPDGFYMTLVGLKEKLAGSKQLRMDIYNAGPYAFVSLEFEDAFGNYYSSGQRFIPHGWNTRIFDFTNSEEWEGSSVSDATLANLTWVGLKIVCRYPGRLVFDGFSAGQLALKGAGKAGGLLSFSYNPNPGFEIIAETRVEDTFYGRGFDHVNEAGTEAYLDNASFRTDVGDFRSTFMYRRRITALDQPIFHLISPFNLGREIAAWELSGRRGRTEMQLLAASRLEYDEYNSRVPTGFGPEGVLGLRCRRDISENLRLGATAMTHNTWYGTGVLVPERRHTFGLDMEGMTGGNGKSLDLKLEGALTGGDKDLHEDNAPNWERHYLGTSIAPEWGRLKVKYGYTHFGYGFDGAFTPFGANWHGHDSQGHFKLQDFWIFRGLNDLGICDGSFANELALNWAVYTFAQRDYYIDENTGSRHPREMGYDGRAWLGNDYKGKPHFELGMRFSGFGDQWYRDFNIDEFVSVRVPLYRDFVALISGSIGQRKETDRDYWERGTGVRSEGQLGLERYCKGNLFLSCSARLTRSRDSWEGEWYEPDYHFRWQASARKTMGANSMIDIAFGQPALKGMDYGVQDTINVLTVTGQIYF